MEERTALLNPPEHPDNGGQFLQRRDDCPPWCVGHRHTDGEDTRCMAKYGPTVNLDDGDYAQLYAVKDSGKPPVVALYFGSLQEQGGSFKADELRALIGCATEGLHLIDPPAPTMPKAA